MHQLLDQHPGGISQSGTQDFKLLDAFSTYFHETLHWWQHIGSTTGLLLSLSPPMQSHINYEHLKFILQEIGPEKPLERLTQGPPGRYAFDVDACLNRIVNNWHDLEFNRRILLNPKSLSDVLYSPYFESQGHSIEIGLANLLLLLGATFDSDFRTVPHPRSWEAPAADLRNRKVDGYFFGSTVRTTPIGAWQIFEGQARFSQLQYLYLATNGRMSWDEFRRIGMLSGVYVEAFETFLRLTGCKWPSTPIAADVLLFLLICDLAVNPSDGYPFDIRHFESLVESADPGIRFCWFCSQIAKHPNLRDAVEKCDSGGYLEASTHLCKSIACETPVGVARELMKWVSEAEGFAKLLTQESTSSFSEDNLPLRVCFAKHLRFAEQRIRRPEFFCWPAMYFVERKGADVDLQASLDMFNKHQPPFVAHPNGEIRPALFQGISEKNMYETFNTFYHWILQYDLISQWVVGDGPYDLDFTWMHPLYTPAFTRPWADRAFKNLFGISLDDFKIGPN
ncbi:MAG: hypothetical protein WCL11_25245 [Verrucomicrobiota bacterium]